MPPPDGLKLFLVPIFLLSGVINLLYLTGSWFMLEVYDRVVPGRSMATLIGLAAIVAMLYAFQASLEILRSRALVRVGLAMAMHLGPTIFALAHALRLQPPGYGGGGSLQADLERVQHFLSGPGYSSLFDLPWIAVYLWLCFAFHPLIGWTTAVGAVVLIVITIIVDFVASHAGKRANADAGERDAVTANALRNAEVVAAMGMQPALSQRWTTASLRYLRSQKASADVAGTAGGVSKALRMALQSLVLAVGAALVIRGETSAGVMIACTILTSRALAPVDAAIGHWRSLVAARQSWARLRALLRSIKPAEPPMSLPPPTGCLSVQALVSAPNGHDRPVIEGIDFTLSAGDGLAILGESASGKSSLARALVGVWPALGGSVRLDGATFNQWSPDQRGRNIGYLPQTVELFDGTLAQNIARFSPDAEPKMIIAAATAANVHEMIVGLPQGYDTPIGDQGSFLSAGQRQRIGLARALYGHPFLVVLDEPNSNLDANGENALAAAIIGVRKRGGIVIVVAHRPAVLASLNKLLVMANGHMVVMGAKDEVLSRMLRQPNTTVAKSAFAPEHPIPHIHMRNAS